MMSLSLKRLRRKSPTSGRVLGPPMFNIKIPVLALADSFMVAFNDTSEIAAWHADHV